MTLNPHHHLYGPSSRSCEWCQVISYKHNPTFLIRSPSKFDCHFMCVECMHNTKRRTCLYNFLRRPIKTRQI
jgi:hypothetical protein